jgi:hypothetical protein
MYNWITDRTQENVDRLNELRNKGWSKMTPAEKAEWTGDPLTAADMGYEGAVNLFPTVDPYVSKSVRPKWRNTHIDVEVAAGYSDAYALVVIGDAADFEGKTLTLSVSSIVCEEWLKPLLSLYWWDEDGSEELGVSLSEGGSVTFTASGNAQNRAYLAARMYVSGTRAPEGGEFVRYNGVMLELGSERHSYVPYTEVLPTKATKGAFNTSDWNRIGRAITEIGELIHREFDAELWVDSTDIPLYKMCQFFTEGINRIREAFLEFQIELPETPSSMESMTFEAANQIETFLATAYLVALRRG